MNFTIIKNSVGTYDVYRIEVGAQHYVATYTTKKEALGLT
jgi:hypothetical protein